MRTALLAIAIVFLSFINTARAGNRIGELCWWIYPYDDIFCVVIEASSATTFTLSGDFSSLADGYSYPVSGSAIYDLNTSEYKVQLQTAVIDGGMFINFALAANINPSTFDGTWIIREPFTGIQEGGDLLYLGAWSDLPEPDPSEGRHGLFGDR